MTTNRTQTAGVLHPAVPFPRRGFGCRTLAAVFFAAVLAIALVRAAAAAETVVIAAEDDWAPYSSMSADRSGVEGLAPDLVRAAFKTQGVDVSFLTLPFARCMFYAQEGKVAGCFNATITDGNRDAYHWHATPLFHEGLAIFGRAESTDQGLREKDLEGKTVGVTIGYTYPTSFLKNDRITKVNTSSDANLLRMLVAGRVDYILLNTMPGYYRIRKDPTVQGRIKLVGTIRLDGFWVAFSRQHPEGRRLADVLEKGLNQIKADGTYDQLLQSFKQKWGL